MHAAPAFGLRRNMSRNVVYDNGSPGCGTATCVGTPVEVNTSLRMRSAIFFGCSICTQCPACSTRWKVTSGRTA